MVMFESMGISNVLEGQVNLYNNFQGIVYRTVGQGGQILQPYYKGIFDDLDIRN